MVSLSPPLRAATARALSLTGSGILIAPRSIKRSSRDFRMAGDGWMGLFIGGTGTSAGMPNTCATRIGRSDRKDLGAAGVAPNDTEYAGGTSSQTGIDRRAAGIPEGPNCAGCGVELDEPFGWCSNCRAAFCANCGDQHFCM